MGKVSGRPSRTQVEINGIRVEWALKESGVRLKGGDPFVFGRAERRSRAVLPMGSLRRWAPA
ncbi:MAG: hypothetical protein ACLR9Z_13005 [Alitiscatomonas sp.]